MKFGMSIRRVLSLLSISIGRSLSRTHRSFEIWDASSYSCGSEFAKDGTPKAHFLCKGLRRQLREQEECCMRMPTRFTYVRQIIPVLSPLIWFTHISLSLMH